MNRLLLIVLPLLAAHAAAPTGPAGDSPRVTYVANAGFLLEHGGKKVLIDALFDAGAGPFLSPSEEVRAQLAAAQGPFAGVDLLLVTHRHADHFDAKLVAAHLRSNPRCGLIAPPQAVDLLRREEGFDLFRGRIRETGLVAGGRKHVTVNGIEVDVLGLAHMPFLVEGRNVNEQVGNIGFIVNLAGTRFLHPGDATVEHSLAHLGAFPFGKIPVDFLFVGSVDRSLAAREFIGRKIKPGRIIAMHVPPAEAAARVKEIRAAYPHAVTFERSMEQRQLGVGARFHALAGEYFGQKPPGAVPEVFARGIVSTDYQEHGAPNISADGNELYWTVGRRPHGGEKEWEAYQVTMRRENGRWSAPWVGEHRSPVFSADGRRMYVTAARPGLDPAKAAPMDVDVWVAEKQGDTWGEARCLNFVARYPELRWARVDTISLNGTLYLNSYSEGPLNGYAIYRAPLVNGEYGKPELLPRSINLPPFLNWTAFIAPDESYLLFSSNRTGSLDQYGDLYVSHRRADGSWTDPVGLGEAINTSQQERFPRLSNDGKYLLFSRYTPEHDEDIFWVDVSSIAALRASRSAK